MMSKLTHWTRTISTIVSRKSLSNLKVDTPWGAVPLYLSLRDRGFSRAGLHSSDLRKQCFWGFVDLESRHNLRPTCRKQCRKPTPSRLMQALEFLRFWRPNKRTFVNEMQITCSMPFKAAVTPLKPLLWMFRRLISRKVYFSHLYCNFFALCRTAHFRSLMLLWKITL